MAFQGVSKNKYLYILKVPFIQHAFLSLFLILPVTFCLSLNKILLLVLLLFLLAEKSIMLLLLYKTGSSL